MKKLLIATAALAMVAGTAQAQSSVTVYGILDINWTTQDNDAGSTASTAGQHALATSRLGFKGTEDLGGGLKANFVLESQIAPVAGTAGATNAVTFNRGSWVGLQSDKFGEIRLGKQDVTYANDIDTGVSQMGNMGNFGAALGGAGELGKDKDNAVVYVSPTFNGLQLQAGYATANTTVASGADAGIVTEVSTGGTTSYMLSYAQGPLKLFAAKQEEQAAAASANKTEKIYGASYDAGFASFGIAMQDGSDGSTKNKQTNYTVAVPVKALGSGVKVHAGLLNNTDDDTANADATTTRLAITKALSKRTTLYAAYSSADYDSAYTTATLQGKTVTTTAVGVLHTF